MRIIAGKHKGRRIEAPPEKTTRPTVDRVREALFSSLESMRGGFEGAVVLDAFAGSGALAIEAVSRGAEFAYLIERDRAAFKTIERNIRDLGIDRERFRLEMRDSFKARPSAPEENGFDIVFLDPPYSVEPQDVVSLIEKLCDSGCIARDALFVYEHDGEASDDADAVFERSSLSLSKRRSYGRVVVDILKQDICANI